MICLLHGYLLEGSGSNLWTRAIIEALVRAGTTVHLMAQENHPDRYPAIIESRHYLPDGTVDRWHNPERAFSGGCILHRPELGDTLPVYVWDRYEDFGRVVPMVDLSDAEINDYLDRNEVVLQRIVDENGITALHANHAVLMSVVAQRISARNGIPFSIMPHGSALEYALKRDVRFLRLAAAAFNAAGKVFVHGEEMRHRVRSLLPEVPLEHKFSDLHLGVDTRQFKVIPRSQRSDNMRQLAASLQNKERGRTQTQTQALEEGLLGSITESELVCVMDEARKFDNKAPDAQLEDQLAAENWNEVPTLLYVGRLISTKGVQSVLAALPLLIEERPDLRVFMVGHGPLREPLEALLWALRHGERTLVDLIVSRGRALEGAPEGHADDTSLSQVEHFLNSLDHDAREHYFGAAQRLKPDTVLFTGYLTHHELRLLFPCCDVSVFPSVVREAGPLVFLEALASGSFPLGTNFGGMRASIDSIADAIPSEATAVMRISADPHCTVRDIVNNVPRAFELTELYKEELAAVARERYDWTSVAAKFERELEAL